MGAGRWLPVAILLVVQGCDDRAQVTTAETGTNLPGIPAQYAAECTETETESSMCPWAASVAELIRGRVLDVSAALGAPFVHATTLELLDRCEGGMNIGLRVRLRIEDVIRGSLTQNQVVEVHVGAHQAATWRPFPVVDEGELRWIAGTPPLREGQVVVMAAHWSAEHTILSSMGDRMYEVVAGEDGETVRAQAGEGTTCPSASEEQGEMTYTDFAASVAACRATAESEARSSSIVAEWTAHPHYFTSSVCFAPARVPGPCLLDSDCEYNQYCVSSSCG